MLCWWSFGNDAPTAFTNECSHSGVVDVVKAATRLIMNEYLYFDVVAVSNDATRVIINKYPYSVAVGVDSDVSTAET